MDTQIRAGVPLTKEQSRTVKAALALKGTDQQEWAKEKGVSYSRLNRVIGGREVPSTSYARLLSALAKSLRTTVRAAA